MKTQVSIDLNKISNDHMNTALANNKGKKLITKGVNSATRQRREVVSIPTPDLRRNHTNATQHCANDHNSPLRRVNTNIAAGMNKPQASASPKSVIKGTGKSEVEYDMSMVPKVQKSREFLMACRKISHAQHETCKHRCSCPEPPLSSESLPSLVKESVNDSDTAGSRFSPVSASCDSSTASSSTDENELAACPTCLVPTNMNSILPFGLQCESVIWSTKERTHWSDSLDEMRALCASAEHRKQRAGRTKRKKDSHPPIPKNYIKDRIEIDDPLRGYQIRHKNGWLQGFIMMTNFTTWTHYFKWDSMHESNGIDRTKPKGINDDNTLAAELEKQKRSGNPDKEGVVWPSIAEIGLVGALGCGEYLLQMALDDISRRHDYDYVVLEATDASRPFYEKFGFIRVGAVCKYGDEKDVKNANGEVQDVGYRHWTYSTETEQHLNEHGGPSCMMARRINKFDSDRTCEGCGRKGTFSFIDQLGRYFVAKKPSIQPLKGKKRSRSNSSGLRTPPSQVTKRTKTIESRVTASGRKSKTPARLEEEEIKPQKPKPKSTTSARTSKNSSAPTVVQQAMPVAKGKGKSNKPVLVRKQKIPNQSRDPSKQHFYNKVVKAKSGEQKYYFVLNYDVDAQEIRVIPLFHKGIFKGKHSGKDKWKANVLPREENMDDSSYFKSMGVITSSTSRWDIVDSTCITKSKDVKEESWVIRDDTNY